jgi:hypothetical protein
MKLQDASALALGAAAVSAVYYQGAKLWPVASGPVLTQEGGDDFNRANQTPIGAPWQPFLLVSTPALQGNKVIATSGTQDMTRTDSHPSSADCYLEALLASSADSNATYDLVTRADQTFGDGCVAHFSAAGATWTVQLGTENVGFGGVVDTGIAAADGLRLVTIGTTMSAWMRVGGVWQQVAEAANDSVSGVGLISLALNDPSVGVDSLTWGTAA